MDQEELNSSEASELWKDMSVVERQEVAPLNICSEVLGATAVPARQLLLARDGGLSIYCSRIESSSDLCISKISENYNKKESGR